ncbi:hypothetical protein [Arthrobacter roseus]|uniref:hypothetical protein n=1 Tax=Arthrobacter roseus TaxID=136274 RepID=UPI001964D3D3|nr:hypothetical protein [Arthrobacter roseus]MBM7848096.1 hypothetical protein [Arthrobacter roseus]
MNERWDMEQAILQGRAMHLRDQLGIDEELRRLGEPMLTGSAALHVMVARDIDVIIAVPRLDAETRGAVVAIGARLSVRPDVREVIFRNDTGKWNTEPTYPDGLYLRLECTDERGELWTMDLWFVDEPARQPDIQHLESIGAWITPVTQAHILAIKRATLGIRDDGSRLPSYDVYKAVLDEGIRTPEEFARRVR